MTDPYKQLARVAGYLSFSATLVKRDGTSVELAVKAERTDGERIESQYPGSLRVRAWSADVSDLLREDGTVCYPADGDRLRVACRDGVLREYSTARESATSRYWNWRYGAPGNRIVFYTKTEGIELENGKRTT